MSEYKKGKYSFSLAPALVLVGKEIVEERKNQVEGFIRELEDYSIILRDLAEEEVSLDLRNELLNIAMYISENAEIYRKFGFEFVMDKREMMEKEHRRKPSHSVIRRKAEKSDLVKLSIFAQQAMDSNHRIALSKDLDYFKQMLELVEVENGEIELFIQKKVIVGYRIFIDGEILEEVLDSSLQTLSWQSDVRKPYAMARLINIRKTLRLLSFKDFKERTIRITDPILNENNGCFKMNFHHGSVKLDKIENQEDVDFDVSIGELTAHIFCYKKIPNFPTVCKKDSFFINDYV